MEFPSSLSGHMGQNTSVCYFDPKKYTLKAKICNVLAFMLINLWTLQCTVNMIFICFANKDVRNLPTKVGYFSKITETFSTALMAQSAKRQQKYKIHLSFYSTCGYIVCGSLALAVTFQDGWADKNKYSNADQHLIVLTMSKLSKSIRNFPGIYLVLV